MSITDELRAYVRGHSWKSLTTIADRIDAEHEKAIRELNNLADAVADSCVQLPKDANGEYIHIGDELDGYGYQYGGAYCKAIVNEVTILAGPKDSSYKSWLMWDATEVRHHHELTVEDVLREFGDKYCDMVAGSDKESDLIAEYAAKLQLKEQE